jgi:hypothetical protein
MSTPHLHLVWCCLTGILLQQMACTVPAQKDTHTILHPYVSIRAAVIRLNASPVGAPIINRTGTYKSSWLSEAAIDRSRLSGDQISLSDNKRWADSLDANFQSVLSQDLGIQLGTQRIVLFPWYGRPDIDYEVEVQVQRFDTGADNRSHLHARWIIKDGRTGRELMAKESNISSSLAAINAAGSEALSDDVKTLSATISRSLVGLSEGAETPVQMSNPAAAELAQH